MILTDQSEGLCSTEFDSLLTDLLSPQTQPVAEHLPRLNFCAPTVISEMIKTAKVMIVDDEPINVKVVRKYLQAAGYTNFVTTVDSRHAVQMVRQEMPDVILLDIMMPHVSGLEILRTIRSDDRIHYIPVLILTAACDPETKLSALELGATDFLGKPVDRSELVPRIRNALVVKSHHDHLSNYSGQLEDAVRQRTMELEASRQEVIYCLARAAEYRDNETGRHVIRVGRFAAIIAEELGFSRAQAELLEQAAQLHDVGKIGIPDSILLKPGKLDHDEFERMRKHCAYGRHILEPMTDTEWQQLKMHTDLGARIMDIKSSPVIRLAARIAQSHHEKWDGSGYPLGLKGEDIPLEGRITAVADVFDALSSKRPYKEPLPRERCFEILREGRGTHFDPRILDAFFARSEDIIRVQIEFSDLE